MSEEEVKPKRKAGRPKGAGAIVLTEEQKSSLSDMAKVGCNLDQIAGILRISPKTLDRMIENDPSISDAISSGRANGINKVAATAYQMAVSGKVPAMTMFFLKTRARWAEARDIDPEPEQADNIFQLNYAEK